MICIVLENYDCIVVIIISELLLNLWAIVLWPNVMMNLCVENSFHLWRYLNGLAGSHE